MGGSGIGGIASLKLTKNGFRYREVPTLDFSGIGDGTATVTATIGGYEDEHATRWIGDDGFISSANYIQDSLYYQVFSYEIKSGNSIGVWKDYVKRLVHPSGLALFGRTMITGLLSTKLAMAPGDSDPELRTPYVHTYPYKIIFHDGDIEPPVRLNVQLQGNNTGDPFLEWPTGGVWPHDGQASGPGLGPGHSDWHIYEIDLPIILLSAADAEDYEFILHAMGVQDDYGLIADLGLSVEEDWGFVSGGIGGQLQLGPLKRQIDQQKFNKEGGFSKSSYWQCGSGYTQSSPIVCTVSAPDAPGGGTQAEVSVEVGSMITSAGVISNAIKNDDFIIVNAGTGYQETPTIQIPAPAGAGGTQAYGKLQIDGKIARPLNFFGDGQTYAAVSGKVIGFYLFNETHLSKQRDGIKRTPDSGTLSACPHLPAHADDDIISGGTNNLYDLPNVEDVGGGYTIQQFKDAKISAYITNLNEKTNIVMNSDIHLVFG